MGAHADAFDIARAQGAAAVQQPALDDRRVADQRLAVPHERVHAAQRVLPVVLGQLALEHVDEQGARRRKGGAVQIGGVCDAQPCHRTQAAWIGCVSALTKSSSWPVVQHSNARQCCS